LLRNFSEGNMGLTLPVHSVFQPSRWITSDEFDLSLSSVVNNYTAYSWLKLYQYITPIK